MTGSYPCDFCSGCLMEKVDVAKSRPLSLKLEWKRPTDLNVVGLTQEDTRTRGNRNV